MEARVKSSSALEGKIFIFSLSSGGSCYIIPKYGCSLGYAAAVVGAGSSDLYANADGESLEFPRGTAHFLEHKLFEKENGDCMSHFASLGVSANAFTDLSKTVYYFSGKNNFYDALGVLSKMVFNPYFTEKNIEKEIKIIQREIAMYKDNPSWKAYFMMLKGLYGKSRRFGQISGNAADVEKINSSTLRKFYDCFYTGENISFVVCADVDPMKCAEIIEKNAVKRNEKKVYFEPELSAVKKPLRIGGNEVNLPSFNVGFRFENIKANVKNICAVNMILNIAAGKGSDYYSTALQKRLCAYPVLFSQSYGRDFYFASAEGKSQSSEDAALFLMRSVEQIRKRGIKAAQLEQEKRAAREVFIKNFRDAQYVMHRQAFHIQSGGDIFDEFDAIKSIDREYINRILETGFKNENTAVSIYGTVL